MHFEWINCRFTDACNRQNAEHTPKIQKLQTSLTPSKSIIDENRDTKNIKRKNFILYFLTFSEILKTEN